MRLTTKGRYAVTSILDLAIHSGDGPVPLADISARQGISLSYLEQLFAKMRRRGLVSSTRGPGGGYALRLSAAQINMSDIIAAVDEVVDCAPSSAKEDCEDHPCLTDDLWMELSDRIYRFLGEISLADLMARADVLEVARRQDARFCQRGQDGVPPDLLSDKTA
jgi:Rrf2 family iron-sulfur cluster assembly transcriptional regulator